MRSLFPYFPRFEKEIFEEFVSESECLILKLLNNDRLVWPWSCRGTFQPLVPFTRRHKFAQLRPKTLKLPISKVSKSKLLFEIGEFFFIVIRPGVRWLNGSLDPWSTFSFINKIYVFVKKKVILGHQSKLLFQKGNF